ncbi:MAG: aminotransferase class I/II-fold pyridoxal phosphate-dependent enzyme, partial [Anaerolineales bacterium]|nr:aminotransferase class I/II-fold pyridoxal phosphate-dependent enzyme [Anaerolineales bacterium]MCB8963392.1 aminotransferase class I/II-fold pyridoxal phosphate-dependent enzyme [Ardenticatenales bacterium]
MSSSFQYDAEIYQRVVDGERKTVNIYGRCGNPSEYQFEEQMALIEGADECLATASGMAAVSVALFGLLKAGDHIVCDWTTYSSTHEMLDHRLTDYGITTTFVDTADLAAVEAAFQPNTKVLYLETVANPSMKVAALPPLVEMAHSRGVVVVCDNTFASPYVMRPLEWGVDLVLESATKFIGGHSDAIGGAICMKSKLLPADFLEQIRWNTMVKLGSALSPFNAWLLLRGIQTLHVRVQRQCETAMALARHFESHPKVKRVWYPGLPSHPQHEIALEQMPKFGGMLTFEVVDGDSAVKVLDSLELATFAASLGGVRTTTQVPATMAFLDIPEEQLQRMNIAQGMIRVSTGLEDASDLMADFDQALAKI